MSGNGLKHALFSTDLFINVSFTDYRIKINVRCAGLQKN